MTPLPPIKKCSFVEGEPEVKEWMNGFYVVVYGEGFKLKGPVYGNQREAIKAWNRKVK